MIDNISNMVKAYLGLSDDLEPYDKEVFELLKPEGFNSLVQHIYSRTSKKETKCYEEAEEIYLYLFGKRRYKDYNVYKSSFHQLMARNNKTKT